MDLVVYNEILLMKYNDSLSNYFKIRKTLILFC